MKNNNNKNFNKNNNLDNFNNNNSQLDINNLNPSDIQHLKDSLNKVKSICNILKEKNNIIDGMLSSTKKRKILLTQEKADKENEIIKLDNEINIYYNKLFSEYFQGDNDKSIILFKIKFLRRELTQNKYIDYLNKKIMVEQKEEKMQKKLSLLTTEQLEQFNKEIYNKDIYNDKEKENIELMKKQYEDIKKTEIFTKIFNEIKEALYKGKYNNNIESRNSSSLIKSKRKFNSKLLNLNQSNKGSCTSLCSQGNYEMRSEMFSNRSKRNRANHSVEVKNVMSNDSSMVNEDINATHKYLLNNRNYGPNNYEFNNSMNKKSKKYNSKLFMSNHNV